MQTDEQDTPRRGWQFRFSLLALFLLMTALCVLLAWWAQPRQCTVEALFQVSAQPPVMLGDLAPPTPESLDLFRRTQVEFTTQPMIVTAALRDPKVAALPSIVSREDPVKWIVENIETEFRQGSEILSMRMRGPEGMGEDLRDIVNAVSKAYLERVVVVEDLRQRSHRDALVKAYEQTRSELEGRLERLKELRAEFGGEDTIDLQLRDMEIGNLKEVLRRLGLQLEIIDVNMVAPPRVRLIQPAVVTSE